VTTLDRTFERAANPQTNLVDVLQTTERALVTLAAGALEQEGIDHAIEHRGLSDQILGQRSTATVGETDEPFAIVVREEDAPRARELMDAFSTSVAGPEADEQETDDPSASTPFSRPHTGTTPSVRTAGDIDLFDVATGTHVGSLTHGQFAAVASHLESESTRDDNYDLTPATLELLANSGTEAEAVAVLQRALGGRPGMDIRWVKN
jgi:hypothetical protein